MNAEMAIELKNLKEDVKHMNSSGWQLGMVASGIVAVVAWSVQHDYYGMQAFAGIGIMGFIVCFLMTNSIDGNRKAAEKRIKDIEGQIAMSAMPQSGKVPEGYV